MVSSSNLQLSTTKEVSLGQFLTSNFPSQPASLEISISSISGLSMNSSLSSTLIGLPVGFSFSLPKASNSAILVGVSLLLS